MTLKTRAEAKAASVEKWTDINARIIEIQNEAEVNCGFCILAGFKARISKTFRCDSCELDAKKICEIYITDDDRSIPEALNDAQKLIAELLEMIEALPDVQNQE